MKQVKMLRIPVLLLGLAAVGAPVASADPPATNPNAQTRTLDCDNGEQVVATFAGDGSNYNVIIDERVFIYKRQLVTSPAGEVVFVGERGIQGFDEGSLVTCSYTNPAGFNIAVTGFFTPQGG
jgi:hypothetical protein